MGFFIEEEDSENEYERSLTTPDKLEVDMSQTPDKFRHLAKEVVSFLIECLQMLNELEREIFERNEVLVASRIVDRISPEEEDLWKEYRQRSREIFSQISLDTQQERTSCGIPIKYEYLNYSDTKITFIMKSASRAIVETNFLCMETYRVGHQFLLKKDGDKWKIDVKKQRFPSDKTWMKHVL